MTTAAPQASDSSWGIALADRCLTVFTTGLHHADPLTFDHEAERVEAMEPSALVLRMRQAVDQERALRTPVKHEITLVPDPGRVNRYRTTCSCGWSWRPTRFEAICRAAAAGDRHVENKDRRRLKAGSNPSGGAQ